MTPFILKDYFPVSGSLEISFVTAQTHESEIAAGYKKLAKLERHFSDLTNSCIKYK